MDDQPTVAGFALFQLALWTIAISILIILPFWRRLGSRPSYLPAVDLISFFVGGLTLGTLLWNGMTSFQSEYPRQLAADGYTNVLEPYLPAYRRLSVLRDEACGRDPASIDCVELRRFISGAAADMGNGPQLTRPSYTLSPDTSAEARAFADEYREAFDLVPIPAVAMREALTHIGGIPVLLLFFAWMLGVHRRWVLFRRALQGA